MYQCCDSPGNRIGKIKCVESAVHGKNGKNPHNAESTCTCQGDNHRQNRVTETSHASNHCIHDAAQKIGGADDADTQHSIGNNLRVTGVNANQRACQHCDRQAEKPTDHRDTAKTDTEYPVDAAVLFPTVILTCET